MVMPIGEEALKLLAKGETIKLASNCIHPVRNEYIPVLYTMGIDH